MEAKTVVTTGEDWIEIRINIANRGDEDALVVSPQFKLGQEEIMLNHIPKLRPNTSHQWTHRFEMKKLGFESKGSYPLLMKIHYHDVNFYPFSMPEIILFHHKVKPSDSPIKGSFSVGEVNHTGNAEVKLINYSQDDLSGTIDLFLPNELVSLTPKTQFQLAKGGKIRIDFKIENAWALRRSSYRIYAVAQWIHSNIHHTLVIPEIIKVTGYRSPQNILPRIVGGIVFLIILFLATLYFEMKNVNRENEPE